MRARAVLESRSILAGEVKIQPFRSPDQQQCSSRLFFGAPRVPFLTHDHQLPTLFVVHQPPDA